MFPICRRRLQYTRCQTRSTEAKTERQKCQILRLKSTREEKNVFIMPFCRELCVIKWWACCLGRRRGGAGWLATSPQPADRSWISPIRCVGSQSGAWLANQVRVARQSCAWLANQVRGSPIRCVARQSDAWLANQVRGSPVR